MHPTSQRKLQDELNWFRENEVSERPIAMESRLEKITAIFTQEGVLKNPETEAMLLDLRTRLVQAKELAEKERDHDLTAGHKMPWYNIRH